MSLEFSLKFLGILLGVIARTLLPWLRKLREGRVRKFSKRYVYSAIGSFILGLILTLVIFPQFEAPGTSAGFEACFKLFCLAFGFGFGWNALLVEGGEWVGAFKKDGKTPREGLTTAAGRPDASVDSLVGSPDSKDRPE